MRELIEKQEKYCRVVRLEYNNCGEIEEGGKN